MRLRGRPKHQLIIGATVVVLMTGPVVVWVSQLVRVLAGCRDGLGNPGMTGRLSMEYCVLSDADRPLLDLPWAQDLYISGLLAFVLVSVVAALLVPRFSKWSHSLAVVAAPALVFAGLSMGRRGFERRDGQLVELIAHMPNDSPEGGGIASVHGGWEITVGDRQVLIPDVSTIWLAVAFCAGVALLVLVTVLLADHRRRRRSTEIG